MRASLLDPLSIPTNILTDRLRKLEANGLITRAPLPDSKRFGYRITNKGRDLRDVLLALASWGNRHLEETWTPPDDYLLQ